MSAGRKLEHQKSINTSLAKLIKSNPKNSTELAQKLLLLGAEPNAKIYDYELRSNLSRSTNPAREAAKVGNVAMTTLLLMFGAMPCNQDKTSAIVSAAKRGHWDTVLLYRENFTGTVSEEDAAILGHALLHAAKDESDKAYEAAVMLIEAGADVNFYLSKYLISLRGAARCNILDKKDRQEDVDYVALPTALHLAMHRGDVRMIKLLITHQAEPYPAQNVGIPLWGQYLTPVEVAERNKDSLTVIAFYAEVDKTLKHEEKKFIATGL